MVRWRCWRSLTRPGLKKGDLGTTAIAGRTGPIDKTLGVCDFVAAFKGDGTKQSAIKKFLDFGFQDKYRLIFVHEKLELFGTASEAVELAKTDATLAPVVKALPNAVQYPNDPVWAQVNTQIIGTAIGPDPKAVLTTIQQTALKGS
jgi:multiple sugar transport system substrate-binding protein